jgi:hypothetical protein
MYIHIYYFPIETHELENVCSSLDNEHALSAKNPVPIGNHRPINHKLSVRKLQSLCIVQLVSVGVKRHMRFKPSCLVSSQILFYGDGEILTEISVTWRSEHTHMTPRRVRVNHRPRWSDDLETPAPETFCLGHQTSPFRRACVCVVVSAFVSEVEQNMLFLMFFSCCVIESESILKKKLCTFGFIEVFDNSCRHGCRRLVYLTGPWSTCFSVIHLFIFLDSKRTYFKKSKIGDQISSDGMVFRKVPICNRPWTSTV